MGAAAFSAIIAWSLCCRQLLALCSGLICMGLACYHDKRLFDREAELKHLDQLTAENG